MNAEHKQKASPAIKEHSLEDAVSEAYSELASLGEEMRSWADNLEEKFSSTEKYARVSEAADALESNSEPQVLPILANIMVGYSDLAPRKRGYSRSDRCGQACYIIDAIIEELEKVEGDESESQDRKDAAESLRDELGGFKDEVECIEFPGMYG